MRTRPLVAVASLMLAIGISGALAQPAESVKMATVNPAKILEGMKEARDAQDFINQEVSKLRDAEKNKRQELVDLEGRAKLVEPGTPQQQQLIDEHLRKSIELETWLRISNANLQRLQKQKLIELYEKIRTAAEKVAVKRGYDLVLTEQVPEIPKNLGDMNPDQIKLLILQRNPVYNNLKADITSQVVLELNTEYLTRPTTRP
jgi:Skp family chaperone for outer membrane proteins